MMQAIGKITFAGLLAALVLAAPLRAAADDNLPTVPGTNAPVAGVTTNAPAAKAKAKAKPAKTKAKPAAKKTVTAKAGNLKGKLAAIDQVAKSITLEGTNALVYYVSSTTRIQKGPKNDEKPATLNDGSVGDSVTGAWTKSEDGKMILKTLNFNPAGTAKKPGKKAAAKASAKASAAEKLPATAPAPADTNAPPAKL